MHVVATAGHVDHGKSTLIRALTDIEPDRWAEERRRGLTIDLGFAWTTLPSGFEVAFVDVPGHERFLTNMLAGLAPVSVVLFVVAVDEGWCAQSSDHRDAIAALGIWHGVIVLSRVDRAPDRADAVLAEVRRELAETGLRDAPVVAVSAVSGAGMEELRAVLDAVLAQIAAPAREERVRIWIDRSFNINGAGAVVTGTLSAGVVHVGDQLELRGAQATHPVTVRGLQREGRAVDEAVPLSRVAVNLRGISATQAGRGDALVTPEAWWFSSVMDVRFVQGEDVDELPEHVTAHLGTAALPTRVRSLGSGFARITLDHAVPISIGDRLVLRSPGERILGGAVVVDPDPPGLRRRGDAARRAEHLTSLAPANRCAAEVARRGAVQEATLRRLGLTDDVPNGVTVVSGWWIDLQALTRWARHLRAEVSDLHHRQPLARGMSRSAVPDALGLPTDAFLDLVVRTAELDSADGYVRDPAHAGLGAAEQAVARLEARLASDPFRAPEADELAAAGLGQRELAAAERTGRLLRLSGGVVLLPNAPAQAMRVLAALDQPFTTSDARQAFGTTRRVVIPLLEYLDQRGWTRRLDSTLRHVVR